MKIGEIKVFLNEFDDNLEVKFLKYPSHKPLGFWDMHEWYICKKLYREGGPKDENFLAILVEDE